MFNLRSITPAKLMLPVVGALMLGASVTHAIPIVGEVINDNSSYSVVHLGDTPGGWGDSNEWLWFDDNQPLYLEVLGNDVSLYTPLSYDLSSQNGATGSLTITALDLVLNNTPDGFGGGTMDYILNGVAGQFVFADDNYNNIFNTANWDGNALEFYVWGGDEQNELGIDFAFSGEMGEIDLPPTEVPVPATWLLLMLGLGGVIRFNKKGSAELRA